MGYGVCFVHVKSLLRLGVVIAGMLVSHVFHPLIMAVSAADFGQKLAYLSEKQQWISCFPCDIRGFRSDGIRSQIIVTTALKALWTAHGAQWRHGGSDKLIYCAREGLELSQIVIVDTACQLHVTSERCALRV
jgi:hypothetical protein